MCTRIHTSYYYSIKKKCIGTLILGILLFFFLKRFIHKFLGLGLDLGPICVMMTFGIIFNKFILSVKYASSEFTSFKKNFVQVYILYV